MMPIKAYFFTRVGCHLCDEAREAIKNLPSKYQLTVTEIDVDDRKEDQDKYGEKVPVLVIEGGTAIESFITEKALRQTLDRLSKNVAF